MQSLLFRQAVFTLGVAGFCGLELLIAFLCGMRGNELVVGSILLCLVPGWMTIYAGDLLKLRDLSAYVVLIGTGLRMMFVLIGFIAVAMFRPDLDLREFAVWVVASYLVALALETWMVLIPSAPPVAK